jgi:hypothetical protein
MLNTTSITLADSFKTGAFFEYFPKLKKLEEYCLRNVTGLTEFYFPPNLEVIERSVFEGLYDESTHINKINNAFPATLKSISSRAFGVLAYRWGEYPTTDYYEESETKY